MIIPIGINNIAIARIRLHRIFIILSISSLLLFSCVAVAVLGFRLLVSVLAVLLVVALVL